MKKLYCQNCGATINKWTAEVINKDGIKTLICLNCGSTKISTNDPFEIDNKTNGREENEE